MVLILIFGFAYVLILCYVVVYIVSAGNVNQGRMRPLFARRGLYEEQRSIYEPVSWTACHFGLSAIFFSPLPWNSHNLSQTSRKSPGLFLLLKTTFLNLRWFRIPGCPSAPSLDRAASRCSAAATLSQRATAASSTQSASVGKQRKQSHVVGKRHQIAERRKRVKDITLKVDLVNKKLNTIRCHSNALDITKHRTVGTV